MRVLIIGAGLGGLCLTQGLRKAGIPADVYERDPAVDVRYQGFRIGLDEGRAALAACLPTRLHELLDATCGDLSGARRVVDEHLVAIREMPRVPDAVAVDRHVLRHLLLAGIEDRVHFGATLTGVTERPDGTVRAAFADGTEATGDVLVGADGIGSVVRRTVAPTATITDTGVRFVLGRTPWDERFTALVPGFGTVVSGPGCTLMLGTMRFRHSPRRAAAELAPEVRLPDTGDYLRWVMMLPPEHEPPVAQAAGGQAARATVLDLIDGWHPDLRDLVERADTANSSLLSIRVAGPIPDWTPGSVTLLGDAIHVTSPSGGNGANTALRDAALLSRLLATAQRDGTSPRPAIAAYERRMRDYGGAAVRQSVDALHMFQHELRRPSTA